MSKGKDEESLESRLEKARQKRENSLNSEAISLIEKRKKLRGLQVLRGRQNYLEIRSKYFHIKLPKRALKLAIIMFSSISLLLVWSNREKLSPDRVVSWLRYSFASFGKGPGFPISLEGSKLENGNFMTMGKDLLTLSNSALTVFTDTGKKLTQKPHSFNNPILKAEGQNVLMYNLQGKGFQVGTKFDDSFKEHELDDHIFVGDISEHGAFGFITDAKGYFSKMTILSKAGKEVYKYYFADHIINGMALNKDGDLTAAVGVSAENGRLKSSLYVFDYRDERPKRKFEYKDVLFLEVKFLSNGSIVAIGDTLVTVVDVFSDYKQDYSYNEKFLTSYDISKKDGAVLSLAESADCPCELVLLKKDGHVGKKVFTDLNIKGLSYNDRNVLALSDGKLSAFSANGRQLCSFDVGKDISQVRLLSATSAYLLGIGEIRIVSF